MNELDKKIKIINKYFKRTNIFLELYLINYETFNLYFRIDYMKKIDAYKLSWIDLDTVKNNNVEKYISSEYISKSTIKQLINMLDNRENNYHVEEEKNIVILSCYLNEGYHYQFARFIPEELKFLSDIFITIFDNLPRKLEDFLYELHAEVMHTKSKYEYRDIITFDLYQDDLSKIFDKKIIENTEKYHKQSKVKFLEKIDDKYYAVLEDTQRYLIVLKYNDKSKEVLFYCTCPCEFYCEHMYLVIKAIRKNKTRKFYKILYINTKGNLLENSTNNKYILSSGTKDNYIEIINKYGELELLPLLDNNNKLNFKILEDDEKNSLSKEIKKIIH